MLLPPGYQGGEGWHERLADVGQGIFYAGRNFWIDLAMDKVTLLQVLERLREHLLRTVRHQAAHLVEAQYTSHSRPLVAYPLPFADVRQEGNMLYFATSTKKAVWQELQENSNVEILAYADNVSVRCSGMVNFYVSEDMKRWIYDHNDVLSSLYNSYDQLEYFCLPIAELDYFDLSPTPPINQHFDLMAGEMANGFVGERFSK